MFFYNFLIIADVFVLKYCLRSDHVNICDTLAPSLFQQGVFGTFDPFKSTPPAG